MERMEEWKNTHFQLLEIGHRELLVPLYMLHVLTYMYCTYYLPSHLNRHQLHAPQQTHYIHENISNASPPLTVVECLHCDRHSERPSSGTGVTRHSDAVVSERHQTHQQV